MSGTENELHEQSEQLVEKRPELPPRIASVQSPPAAPQVPNQNVFAVLMKNIRQITSLTAGLIILLASGVHTVWAFWEIYAVTSWNAVEVITTIGTWYVGTILGSIVGAFLVPRWSKRRLYILSSIILMLSSFLFVSRRFYELRSLWIFSAGRFLAGLANGLAYLAVIVQAAENAVNQIRGVILRFIGYMLAFSLFIAGFTTNGSIENDINSECIMGYLTLFYSVLALIAAPLLTIESVPFILQQTNDGRSRGERESLAIETMIRLRNEKGETAKIRYDLDEIKHQLIEDELDSRNPFGHKNCRPLIIVIGVRVLSVCAKNLPFTILIMGYFNKLVNPETFSLYALLLLLSCRFIFGILAMFFIDKFERKKYLYVSSIICGALLFITMVIVFRQNDDENIFDASYCSYGIILFYILASMSIDCVGHVQTSEAFSYATKIWSIVIASCVEHLVHIFLIILFQLQWDTWAFIVTAVGLIVMGHSTLLTVPAKTKGLSLRQTRDIYRAVAHNVNIN